MDRYKFRVWDIEANKYIENEHVLFINPLTGNVFWDTMECELDNVTIEQCTGQEDKNKELVFEGDKIKVFMSNSHHILCEVYWWCGQFMTKPTKNYDFYKKPQGLEYWFTNQIKVEKVGTIHDKEQGS